MINWFLLSFISTCIAWFAPSSENAMMHLEVVVLIDYKRKCITYSYYILSWFSFFFLCLFTLHILGFPCTLACRARMNDAWKNCRLQICHFPWFVKLVKKGQNTYCYVSIKYMSDQSSTYRCQSSTYRYQSSTYHFQSRTCWYQSTTYRFQSSTYLDMPLVCFVMSYLY